MDTNPLVPRNCPDTDQTFKMLEFNVDAGTVVFGGHKVTSITNQEKWDLQILLPVIFFKHPNGLENLLILRMGILDLHRDGQTLGVDHQVYFRDGTFIPKIKGGRLFLGGPPFEEIADNEVVR